ncbi:MAG TPA: zinc metalloprotease HtpX [Candidatus Woesearchaeota archaeon]|nr:zinc metalloprotease HtpX [Candidatus Woesearchaeota archaeon]
MAERLSFHDEIRANKIKSWLLISVVIIFMVLLAYFIGIIYDPALVPVFLFFGGVIVIVQALVSYYQGDKIILKIMGAKEAKKIEHQHLINVVDGLSLASGLPMPKVYVIDSPDMNAFATGRDPEHASVAVTTGLLNNLNRQELEGVIAHEMSHIANYDIRFATIVSIMVGAVSIIASIVLRSMFWSGGGRSRSNKGGGGIILLIIGIAFMILAPIAVKLVQLSISRKREYLADSTGAKLTRYPNGLANALEKISKTNQNRMKVPEAVSHLFFTNPVSRKNIAGLFSTHPPIEERIAKLRAM